MIKSRFSPYLRQLGEYASEYPDRFAVTFRNVQGKQVAEVCASLLQGMARLPADIILDDIPAIAVAYHEQIRVSGDRVVVTKAIQEQHSALVQVLGLSDPETQQFLALLRRIQMESEKGSSQDDFEEAFEDDEDGEDSEDEEGDEDSFGREYLDGLFDAREDQ